MAIVSIAEMRAAGLSAEQIVRLLETAENEKTARQREQWRINSRNYRERHQNHNDANDANDAHKILQTNQSSRHSVINDVMTTGHIDKKEDLSSKKESKKERKKVSIPEFWLPNDAGLTLAREQGWDEHKIKLEIHRFQDHAQQHDRRCVDWQAAWRNWVTSPYQQKGNGHDRPAGKSLVDIGRELADEARKLEAAAAARRENDPFGGD